MIAKSFPAGCDAGPGLPDDADVVTLPASEAVDGRGLWLVHHLVPYFELRTGPSGVTATVIAGQTSRNAVNSIV